MIKTRTTPKGTLYGKTGSFPSANGKFDMGWFVGFIESDDGILVSATNVNDQEIPGAEVRTLTETIPQRF